MNPFAYLRRKTTEAILGGISDALASVAPEGESLPEGLAQLRERASVALPAADETEPATNGNGKVARRRS